MKCSVLGSVAIGLSSLMLGASAWAQSAPTPVVEWHSFSGSSVSYYGRLGTDGVVYTLDVG